MGKPPLVLFLKFTSLLGYVSPPCASLPCHASFAAGGEFGWARVVLVVHRPHEDGVGLEWCMGMPPLVLFLKFTSLLVHVSPPCASLPCHASCPPAGEVGWARVVLVVHRPHEDGVGLEWCMGMPPPPSCTSYTLFLFSFTSPHHALLSLVMLPAPQLASSVGQGLCWLCVHRPHEDVVGLEWCMGMPPPPPLFTS